MRNLNTDLSKTFDTFGKVPVEHLFGGGIVTDVNGVAVVVEVDGVDYTYHEADLLYFDASKVTTVRLTDAQQNSLLLRALRYNDHLTVERVEKLIEYLHVTEFSGHLVNMLDGIEELFISPMSFGFVIQRA